MHAQLRRGTAVLALFLFAAGCAPDKLPTAAEEAPQALLGSVIGSLTNSLSLLECPTSKSYVTTKAIGPAGGVIKVGPHSLSIPARALSTTQTITANAPAGKYVEVKFEPHGLRFQRSATLSLSYEACGTLGSLKKIVYVDSRLNILEVLLSTTDLLRQRISAPIDHFSSYMLAD